MAKRTQELLEELSLMVVMTGEDDPTGKEFLISLCDDLSVVVRAESFGELAAPCAAARELLAAGKTDGTDLRFLGEFVTAAQQFIAGDSSVVFPSIASPMTESEDSQSATTEVGPRVDSALLTEFVETHLILSAELDSQLVDFCLGKQQDDELNSAVKRYLHNLKGDAGAVGLPGIESVCHALEDILVELPAARCVTELSSFREWLAASLQSLANAEPFAESSTDFIERVRTALSGVTSVAVEQSPEKEASPDAADEAPRERLSNPVEHTGYPLGGSPDLIIEFLSEAEDHLGQVEGLILDGDDRPEREFVDTIFRAVHSLKGGAAYFNLTEMKESSHLFETLLSDIRDGKRSYEPRINEMVLEYLDIQKCIVGAARKAASSGGLVRHVPASIQFSQQVDRYLRGPAASPPESAPKTSPSLHSSPNPLPAPQPSSRDAELHTESQPLQERGGNSSLAVKTFVKVETGRLDHLIDSIGEMVIYSSMLIRQCREHLGDKPEVMDAASRVEKFGRDLQDVGMSMRLVPIKGLFQKMSRLVWDTAKRIGKDVTFSMDGEDTELDRNLIDKLGDPLMHMVRNAVDHGIELPDDREQAGKSRGGTIHLSAEHSGGCIQIKIRDDGRGLDPQKLIAKAIEKGVIAAEARLTDSEAFDLIFAPGFSTAAVVTDLSGRGVGMDVVKKNVQSLRGRILIDSAVGKGSTFTIEVPLTLAIIDGIQIRVGAEDFIIPSLSVIEFVRPEAEMISYALDHAETLKFRGKFIPILRLSEIYSIPDCVSDVVHGTLAVVQVNNDFVAMMVDEIIGEYSTVIKSLGPMFGDNRGLAGCAIMPRGDVALILDIRSVVELARSQPAVRRMSNRIAVLPGQTVH